MNFIKENWIYIVLGICIVALIIWFIPKNNPSLLKNNSLIQDFCVDFYNQRNTSTPELLIYEYAYERNQQTYTVGIECKFD